MLTLTEIRPFTGGTAFVWTPAYESTWSSGEPRRPDPIIKPPVAPDRGDYDLQEEPLLRELGSSHFHLRFPLALQLEHEEEQWIAICPELGEYGVGPTRQAAVADLQATIVELYETLSAEKHRLGPDLKDLWAVLGTRVEVVSA